MATRRKVKKRTTRRSKATRKKTGSRRGGAPPLIENPVPWPNGARVAVDFSWNLDADSLLHNLHPDDSYTRVGAMSAMRYGPDIAVNRICNMFEHYDIPLSFFVPGWCIEEHPKACERMLEGGHEIAHHGYMHEVNNLNTRDRELYWMMRASDAIEKFTGQKPRGLRVPWFGVSPHTPQFMQDMGFLYDTSMLGDDVPYVLRNQSGGEIIEIPVHWPNDDFPHYGFEPNVDYTNNIQPPSRAKEVYMAEFNAAWEGRGLWFGNMHPWVSGRPSRMLVLEEMVHEMQDRGGVWFASMEEIARHVKDMIDKGRHTPRIVDVPYKEGKIRELAEDAEPLRG